MMNALIHAVGHHLYPTCDFGSYGLVLEAHTQLILPSECYFRTPSGFRRQFNIAGVETTEYFKDGLLFHMPKRPNPLVMLPTFLTYYGSLRFKPDPEHSSQVKCFESLSIDPHVAIRTNHITNTVTFHVKKPNRHILMFHFMHERLNICLIGRAMLPKEESVLASPPQEVSVLTSPPQEMVSTTVSPLPPQVPQVPIVSLHPPTRKMRSPNMYITFVVDSKRQELTFYFDNIARCYPLGDYQVWLKNPSLRFVLKKDLPCEIVVPTGQYAPLTPNIVYKISPDGVIFEKVSKHIPTAMTAF
jgi:hypothetical protein